jgi:hypothetical protein
MQIILYVVIALLTLIVLLLSISLYIVIKKATYLSKKERDMAKFTIEMYINYGKEIGIAAEDEKEHTLILNELNKLKNKLDG